jgi:hypothetical protein
MAQGDLVVSNSVIDPVTVEMVAETGDLTATSLAAQASGAMRLHAAGNLRLTGGSYAAETLVVSAGPAGNGGSTVSVSGTAFRIGTAALFAAGGGIDMAGSARSTINPLQSAANRFPAAMFDTRRSATALRAIPALMTAATTDQGGIDYRLQTWQVGASDTMRSGQLIFGRDDGGSGAATRAAAGDLRLDLNAGSSPVFLLLDGGTAAGLLDAGRLGVLSLPGAARINGNRVVDLFGRLNNVVGGIAAQYGRTTATLPEDLTMERYNNCVIGSVNCVVPSVLQQPPVPVVNTPNIRVDPGRLDPDVLLPNITDEDH